MFISGICFAVGDLPSQPRVTRSASLSNESAVNVNAWLSSFPPGSYGQVSAYDLGTSALDHPPAPMSPHSSASSSGSECPHEFNANMRNTFVEEGSGMKGKMLHSSFFCHELIHSLAGSTL